jgi:hypothetical protein
MGRLQVYGGAQSSLHRPWVANRFFFSCVQVWQIESGWAIRDIKNQEMGVCIPGRPRYAFDGFWWPLIE